MHDPGRKITDAEDGKPTSLPWDLKSLHEASEGYADSIPEIVPLLRLSFSLPTLG